MREEAAAAARDGKRLLVYFSQDGCPYCRELMQNNFSQRDIVDKTRRNFVAIALNIWGDREVTWTDGRTMSEKEFARMLRCSSRLRLCSSTARRASSRGSTATCRQSRFSAARLRGPKMEGQQTLGDYLAAHVGDEASPKLNEEPFLMAPPFDLRRKAGGKPLAVLFETRHCQPCDEMHRGLPPRRGSRRNSTDSTSRASRCPTLEVVTPGGRKITAEAWARASSR